VVEQVAVEFAVSLGELFSAQADNGLGLGRVGEGAAGAFEAIDRRAEPMRERVQRLVAGNELFDRTIQFAQTAEEFGVGRAGGEVEVADRLVQQASIGVGRLRRLAFHR
jgi:hypothetical protein